MFPTEFSFKYLSGSYSYYLHNQVKSYLPLDRYCWMLAQPESYIDPIIVP
jgi:hypothetical protein